MGVVGELVRRRRARRWQRWTEVDPMDDYARRAGIVTGIATAFLLVIFGMIVVGLVFLR